MSKRDVYQEITDGIIEQLESGTVPWVKPWTTVEGESTFPTNRYTGKSYRGANIPALWCAGIREGYASNMWLSYKQARNVGGHVRKGETGTPIIFVKFNKVQDRDDSTKSRSIPFVKYSTVFNVEQVDDLPTLDNVEQEWNQIADVDSLITTTGAAITHGGDRAFYMPEPDRINMPHKASFSDSGNYYATLLHELTHWTGSKTRLNRLYGSRFGDEAYAREELVAEMGAAFLCAHCGIDGQLQHAEYLASWIKVLKSDKRAIVQAASAAQKAADFVTGFTYAEVTEAA